MEMLRMGVMMDRAVKEKAERAIVAHGMSISEFVRRVMQCAADGGDLSAIAALPRSGVRNGVKSV